jgi:hypothetical protein
MLSLPETCRNIVGNGSIPAKGFPKPPLSRLVFPRNMNVSERPTAERGTRHIPNPLKCLSILGRKDSFIVILVISIFYATYSCVAASLSSLFVEIYHLNELDAGLIYLPFGIACAVTAYMTGTPNFIECLPCTDKSTRI